MFKRGLWMSGWCFAAVLAFGSSPVWAQPSTDDLRQMIEDLQNRIDELERQVDRAEAEEVPEGLEERVEKLEKDTERPKGALDVYWKEGLRLDSTKETEDGVKPFQLKIGGRIQNDWGWFTADDDLKSVADTGTGTEFRRARIAIEGKIYEDYEFKAQYDFAGDPDFKDVYMAANNVPVAGQLKVGHFKEPASLEELTSSKYITFMERALPNVFSPSRNTGFQAMNSFVDDRMTAAAGVFRETDDLGFGEGGGNWALTGRVTGLPWYAEEGRKLVHVGAWGSYRNTSDDDLRVRQRPEAHLPGRFVDTFDQVGAVDDSALFGVEAALVYGPFSAQTEYTWQSLNRVSGEDVSFQGFYIYGSYFITGEHRPYKTGAGAFDKVKPKKNFQISKNTGPGAWEIALRYSHLDLDDEDVRGGKEDNITAGVNWYLNPNMRIMLNYIHAWVEREETIVVDAGTPDEETFLPVDGDFDGFMTRFQVFW